MTRLGQVLSMRPERIAAAWRRVRWSKPGLGSSTVSLLDSVVESFIRELGHKLMGRQGSPWARTTGVLRLSRHRGTRGLYDEFGSLRRCLLDALEVLGGSQRERIQVNEAIDEALDSAVAHQAALDGAAPETVSVPFGGLVVELFEREDEVSAVTQGPSLASH